MGLIIKNNVIYNGAESEPIIYSEEEREVGVWTDGKPLYQTTIHTGALIKDGNWHSIAHNIPNIDKIILFTGIVYAADNTAYPMPNYRPGLTQGICLDATTTNIEYIQNWLDTSPDSYVTLQYTKTIDQPGSGTWTPSGIPAVHYSTDEQVVGTWIDGSTVYEKTFVISGVVSGIYQINMSGIKDFISYYGYIKDDWSPSSIIPIPRVASDGNNIGIENVYDDYFTLIIPSAFGSRLYDPIITIRYTKLTS